MTPSRRSTEHAVAPSPGVTHASRLRRAGDRRKIGEVGEDRRTLGPGWMVT